MAIAAGRAGDLAETRRHRPVGALGREGPGDEGRDGLPDEGGRGVPLWPRSVAGAAWRSHGTDDRERRTSGRAAAARVAPGQGIVEPWARHAKRRRRGLYRPLPVYGSVDDRGRQGEPHRLARAAPPPNPRRLIGLASVPGRA